MKFHEIINFPLWKNLPYEIKCLLYVAVSIHHMKRNKTGYNKVIESLVKSPELISEKTSTLHHAMYPFKDQSLNKTIKFPQYYFKILDMEKDIYSKHVSLIYSLYGRFNIYYDVRSRWCGSSGFMSNPVYIYEAQKYITGETQYVLKNVLWHGNFYSIPFDYLRTYSNNGSLEYVITNTRMENKQDSTDFIEYYRFNVRNLIQPYFSFREATVSMKHERNILNIGHIKKYVNENNEYDYIFNRAKIEIQNRDRDREVGIGPPFNCVLKRKSNCELLRTLEYDKKEIICTRNAW